MSGRQLPVRPDLDQLKHQAKDLLREMREGNPAAILAEAQFALAKSYGASSWARLVQCCQLIDAIWEDDIETVRELVTAHPNLIHENAGIRNDNWGPPLVYAANLGRDRIIQMLHGLGAGNLDYALGRATLQGRVGTAQMLHAMAGKPVLPADYLGGPAYTIDAAGTALTLELGAPVVDADGKNLAPIDVLLESDSRKPEAKHQILEMYVAHGAVLPDTPIMAFHRGRLDLLEAHLRRDPRLLTRTFSHDEIYPREFCTRNDIETQGTPLAGSTLLHLCVDWDELEIARWLLECGMNPDAKAAIDRDGFGGHTALFNTVVSYSNFWMNYKGGWASSRKPQAAPFTQLLLDRGADPNARATLRRRPGINVDEPWREYRDVTPLAYGERCEPRILVSEPAIKLIAGRGGRA